MSEVRIAAESRTEFGKGAARRTRRAQKVPAVLYGHGTEPRHLALPGHELFLALKGGANTLIRLDLGDGESQLALAKDVQRDPIKGFLEHVDLVVVRRGERVTVDVPVHVVGDAAPDTLVSLELPNLSIEAEATHLPTGVDVSVDGLPVGSQIHAKDISLPSGATLATDPEILVVNITAAPTVEDVEADLAAAESDLGIVHEPSDEEQAGEAAGEADSGTAEAASDAETPSDGDGTSS